MNIRIAIADDHPMIIDGLRNILANYHHIQLIDTYRTGAALLEGLTHQIPDVLLLDIQLPDKNGDELAPIILQKYPTIKILTLTNIDSALYTYNMIRLGIKGYVLKSTDQKTIIHAIEKVYNDEQFIEPAMQEKLDRFVSRMKRESSIKPTLTPREKEILQLIVNGDTGQEIAEKLFIGFRTVEHYRANILLKMDVKNTATLVKKALTLGLAE